MKDIIYCVSLFFTGGLLQQSDVRRPEHIDDLMTHTKKPGSDKGAKPKTPKQNGPKYSDRSKKDTHQGDRRDIKIR